jgi:hypothetical protein
MRVRITLLMLGAGLLGAGLLYATAAFGKVQIAPCSAVHVSGGNFDGLTGGVLVAGLSVRNVSHRDCTVATRPWIRLGPISHAVTVSDAPPGVFGSPYATPQRAVTLRPGQRTVTQIYLAPGGCDRARWHVFSLQARAGWASHSVAIGSGEMCKDGTGTIWVGSFQR